MDHWQQHQTSNILKANRLLNIIKCLNKPQLNNLDKFLAMTNHGLTTEDRRRFKKLTELVNKKKLKQEDEFWDGQFPNSKKGKSDKNRAKSRLLKGVESFLSLMELDKDKGMKTFLLTNFYYDNNLMGNLEEAVKKGIRAIKSNSEPDIKNEIILSWLYDKLVNLRKDLRKEDQDIHLMEQHLNDYYAFSRIRIICEKINRHKILNNGDLAEFYEEEINYLTDRSSSERVEIYYNLFELLSKGEKEHFDEINSIVLHKNNIFEPEILKELYGYLLNYCIRKINIGEFQYASFYLDYVKHLESEKLLLDDGNLGIGRYKNVLTAGLILNDLEWSEKFVERHSKNLLDSTALNRKEFYTFNKAMINLWKNNLNESHDLLFEFKNSNMYSKDVYYKISCDKLFLKLIYEQKLSNIQKRNLEAIDAFVEYKIEPLRKYVRNKKSLNEERKKRNRNFLLSLEHLVKGKAVKTKYKRSEYLMFDYIWLLRIQKREAINASHKSVNSI